MVEQYNKQWNSIGGTVWGHSGTVEQWNSVVEQWNSDGGTVWWNSVVKQCGTLIVEQ